jgi:hypothetical protein
METENIGSIYIKQVYQLTCTHDDKIYLNIRHYVLFSPFFSHLFPSNNNYNKKRLFFPTKNDKETTKKKTVLKLNKHKIFILCLFGFLRTQQYYYHFKLKRKKKIIR